MACYTAKYNYPSCDALVPKLCFPDTLDGVLLLLGGGRVNAKGTPQAFGEDSRRSWVPSGRFGGSRASLCGSSLIVLRWKQE